LNLLKKSFQLRKLNKALPLLLPVQTLWGVQMGKIESISRFWIAHVTFEQSTCYLFLDEATREELLKKAAK